MNEFGWDVDDAGRGSIQVGPGGMTRGDRVRLRPRGKSDIFDLALDGKLATVQSFEQDFEDRVYVTVVVDDDPGRDLGVSGKPGHRFFFRPEELELLARIEEAPG